MYAPQGASAPSIPTRLREQDDDEPSPLTRTTTSQTAISVSSTANLIAHGKPRRQSTSFGKLLFSWGKRKRKAGDPEKNGARPPTLADESDKSHVLDTLWMGWKLLFLGSWLNVLILLIPATWILRLATPDSSTLIFASCVLAMIPLVKMHDLAVRELSVRLGGSRTGLLNASMSNIVELVVAIIALRKCELRVVQSSLIGSMLSKLLLILGMCFFAGGMRFTQQDFDSTATQIHSSLLSLSVGAVLLPAAFHFTLSYRPGENVNTSVEQQKQDILRMSHGVSIVLIFIYISYLLFQFWSHSHHFRDAETPSNKLPNAVSVRSMASRVRPGSPNLRKLASPSSAFSVFRSPRAPFMGPAPTMDPCAMRGPYMYRQAASASPPRNGILVSPLATTSQVTLAAPAPEMPSKSVMMSEATSTVRLVSDGEHCRPVEMERSDSGYSGNGQTPSPARESMVSELVSSYYGDMENEGQYPYMSSRTLGGDSMRTRVQLCDEPRQLRRTMTEGSEIDEKDGEGLNAKKPQLSWFLTLVVLTVCTVLVAVNAEWMIDSIDSLSPAISKEWIALILLPTVGSLAECITATNVSVEDQLTLSISVAVGSTIQTALFVIPFMVLLGWVLDKPLALLFDPFESIVLYISVHTMGYVVADGKSNWLEGLILIGLYVVSAVSFWFYPGSNFSSTLAVCSTSPGPHH